MSVRLKQTMMGLAALGALALGGSAIAGAATSGGAATQGGAAQQQGQPPAQQQGGPPAGPHTGANGKQEQALTGDVAAKVQKAALAKLPGGTIVRVETDVDHGSPYEAHVRKSDGTEVEVLVNEDFEVTAVNAMQRP